MGLLDKKSLLYDSGVMPGYEDTDTEQEQTLESVLKKKREKLATSRLGIAPEVDSSV